MELGAFSVSLAVKDIAASIAFYSALGFEEFAGEGKWRILKNGATTLGPERGIRAGRGTRADTGCCARDAARLVRCQPLPWGRDCQRCDRC